MRIIGSSLLALGLLAVVGGEQSMTPVCEHCSPFSMHRSVVQGSLSLQSSGTTPTQLPAPSQLDPAVHATLALMSAATRAGDNTGLAVFGRRIKTYLPPKRGVEHLEKRD